MQFQNIFIFAQQKELGSGGGSSVGPEYLRKLTCMKTDMYHIFLNYINFVHNTHDSVSDVNL